MEKKDFDLWVDKEGLVVVLAKCIMGDITAPIDLIDWIYKRCRTVPDYLFYNNIKTVLYGFDEKGTSSKALAKRLAKSEYGSETGMVLLHIINDFESSQKGTWMAYLLDSLSKGYIEPDECIYYCMIMAKISVKGLLFLKNNVKKMSIYNISADELVLIELKNNALMYENIDDGLSFRKEAYYIDKYALSYNEDEKYGSRSDKNSGIPSIEKFPPQPVYLATGTRKYSE